jgi:hypothetical protein
LRAPTQILISFSLLATFFSDRLLGVVTLAGKVHNSEEKAMVEQKVRSVTGVVKVNNELQIQKG